MWRLNAFALEVTTQSSVQAYLAERSPRQIPVPRYPFYVREDDLQVDIAKTLEARGFDVRREVPLSVGRVDLLAVGGGRHLVIEAKPHSTGRPVFDQIERYRRAYVSSGAAEAEQICAVLVARNFQDDLVRHVEKTNRHVRLVTYSLTPYGALEFTERDHPHGVSLLDLA